ncbi:MAG TPA: aminopeptidase [Candidatus Paceibacterota bacterium]
MEFIPSKKILEKYADVLVNFALNSGKGIRKGDVVRVSAHESAKPLFHAVCNAIVDSGGHVISHYLPDETRHSSTSRHFFECAREHQIDFFPTKHLRGLAQQIDHTISIISDTDPALLRGINPKRIMRHGVAHKKFRDWLVEKERKGQFTWTLGLYGTPRMAKEAGMTIRQYWEQIVRACFLNEKNPIVKWKSICKRLEIDRRKLNALAPRTEKLHIKGKDVDLWVTFGKQRQWLGGSGRNIPSFELFTSPDKRGTEGWVRFNQPLYRYGNKITGIELWFKNGRVVKSKAKQNEKVLQAMIATPGADMIGEFSLTDRRFSYITKFMADTLYDENMGGPEGNTHIALGMSYKEAFSGDVTKLSNKQAIALGFNDSSVHTDIVSTTKRTVTAHMIDGTKRVIYRNGMFVL